MLPNAWMDGTPPDRNIYPYCLKSKQTALPFTIDAVLVPPNHAVDLRSISADAVGRNGTCAHQLKQKEMNSAS